MRTTAVSLSGADEGVDRGHLGLPELQRRALVQHKPKNQRHRGSLGPSEERDREQREGEGPHSQGEHAICGLKAGFPTR
jgi:hypothetical protein